MPRAARPLTLAAAAGAGLGLTIFGVLAFGGAGHAETLIAKPLPAKPLPAMAARQGRAPALPALGARDAQSIVAQDRSGRLVRVVYPGSYAQR